MQKTQKFDFEPEIQKQLDAMVERIIATVPTDAIILFGSYANGTPNEHSDFDLCILTSIEGTRTPTWMQAVRRSIRSVTSMPVDLLMCPSAEFLRRSHHPSSFQRSITEGGIHIYG